MSDALRDRVNDAIGDHYEIEGEIGRGGMAVVYRARDRRLNRPVAIKVLPPELAYDPAIRTRFTREAQTSALLSHAHIVPIYDVGDRSGIAYLVMSYVSGGNLGALLAHEPRQPADEVRRLLSEIADALAYAHLRGVIHRDIKPDNILLDAESGRALVTDFGIARAIEAGTRLTVTGIAVGTPTYMSPEQAVGEREIDGRSDLYSLGAVGYQMLTGRVPFTAGNTMALMMKHMSERPRPIAELRPDAPRPLVDAIERALMKAPEDRWPTAAALRDALSSGGMPGPAWRPERREPVRYASPSPDSARRDRPGREGSRDGPRDAPRADARPVSPRRGSAAAPVPIPVSMAVAVPQQGAIVLEPEHLAQLTPTQRADLRLWHGRVNLLDRIKSMRGYVVLTVGAIGLGIAGFVVGVEDVPPLVLAPIVPIYMMRKLWLRGRSLREAGLKLRRVLLSPRAKWVIPTPPPSPSEKQLEKLVPREVLDGPRGAAVRRAVEERSAILDIVAALPKPDSALLPDVAPAVNALVDRVAHLAQMLHRLDQDVVEPGVIEELGRRIVEAERDSASPEGERRLALLRRQRGTLEELAERRVALARQMDNAVLAFGNLRLDLIKFRSSGLQSALSDVSMATQEARALSREIGVVLEAAAEVRGL